MKKILNCFLCLTSLSFGEGWGEVYSQNLVPNPSFEYMTSCPTGGGQVNKAFPWFDPTFNTPFYFNSCSTNPNASVPANIAGYQYPRTGNAYSQITVFYSTPNGRAYIETPLSDTLVKGGKYCIAFYVSLAEISEYASSSIEVYFSKDSVYDYSTLYNLPYIPQFENPPGNVIADTANWALVSGAYIAGGGEKYMTIGNFKDDANTDTVQVVSVLPTMYSEYYIDDVSVTLCDTTPANTSSITIPNVFTPNNDGINDVFKITTKNITKLNCKIYNRWGILVNELTEINETWDGRNTSGLPCTAGVYYYVLTATGEDGKEYNEKGVIYLSP